MKPLPALLMFVAVFAATFLLLNATQPDRGAVAITVFGTPLLIILGRTAAGLCRFIFH